VSLPSQAACSFIEEKDDGIKGFGGISSNLKREMGKQSPILRDFDATPS
jgi:hypothetical protein